MLPCLRLSDEQQKIVDLVSSRQNSNSFSKPGTGKTTTALAAAIRFFEMHGQRTLILTYNRKLKEECRERVKRLDIEHIVEVHSYHAAASRFFVPDANSSDEALIYEAIDSPLREDVALDFGCIVVDEGQDMTPLFYKFAQHLLHNFQAPPTMLIIGDPFQRIFAYLGASLEYMASPSLYFGDLLHSPSFTEQHLTVCWRITPEMADFINENLDPNQLVHSVPEEWWTQYEPLIKRWWAGGIRSGKPSRPNSVQVVSDDPCELCAALHPRMMQYRPEEIAILARSVRGRNPVISRIIETYRSISYHVTNTTSHFETSENVTKNKTVVSTIHKFKGLERRFVVFVGMDGTWEDLYDDPLELFNLFFVGASRAMDDLLVVVQGKRPYATIRRTPLDAEERPRRMLDLSSMLQHASFDPALSLSNDVCDDGILGATRDSAITAQSVPEHVVDEARYVASSNGAVEDVSPFLDEAVVGCVEYAIDARSFERRCRYIRDKPHASASIREWIAQPRTWTPSDCFRLVLSNKSIESQMTHLWRQVHASDQLASLIGRCRDSTLAMLDALGKRHETTFHATDPQPIAMEWSIGWYSEMFEPTIAMRDDKPHFLSTEHADGYTSVNVVVAPSLTHDMVVWAGTAAAFLSLKMGAPVSAHVLIPNLGACYRVSSRVDAFELLYRVSARRARRGAIDPDEIAAEREDWSDNSFF